ncbi:MAG: acetylxylan esterase, partial [Chthoniobacteraceae bacterium]|nr:acetylxylan esterase [Chthoniobacteraceae bacterium]
LQFSRDVIHGFATQRPEMNTVADWGLFSPQAEAHLQSVMGLHTWNAVRGLDFLLSLPEVDPERTAITGSSGGGTQTMMLAAIDDRIKLSFPVVMVSTGMQGGCSCENASLLRLNTGNVEFAALCAPRPQGMNTANDWTKEMASKGFPELQALYGLYGKKENVFLERGEHFPHNYNAVTRSAFYTFLNKHFQLGQSSPVIERDYQALSREQLTVWDKQHPAPKAADPDFERSLLKWFNADAETQLKNCAATSDGRERVIRPAVETLIGRTFAEVGEVAWEPSTKLDRGEYLEMSGLVTNRTFKEEIAVTFLYPKKQGGRAVIWLDDTGKAALFGAGGSLNQEVRRLVEQGITVIGADLLLQTSGVSEPTRIVNNKRQVPSYTFGYNHSLFAQRTHDVLTLVKFVQAAKVGSHANPT